MSWVETVPLDVVAGGVEDWVVVGVPVVFGACCVGPDTAVPDPAPTISPELDPDANQLFQ